MTPTGSPAASLGTAERARTCFLQSKKVLPNSRLYNRASVREDAPTEEAQASRSRASPGLSMSERQMVASRLSLGMGRWRMPSGSHTISKGSRSRMRLSCSEGSRSRGISAIRNINSLSSVETRTDRGVLGNDGGQASYRMYSVLRETAPRARISCIVPAGIHTARWGGSNQSPLVVATSITPDVA